MKMKGLGGGGGGGGGEGDTLVSLQERRAAALSSLFDRILSDSVPSHLLSFCSWPSVSALYNRNLCHSAAIRLRPVLNLPCSCPPLCILLALLLTIRVRPGLNYSLRFTLLISLTGIAFVYLFIYLFIYYLFRFFPSYRFSLSPFFILAFYLLLRWSGQ